MPEEYPVDFHGREIRPHCVVVYTVIANRRHPALEEGEVLRVKRKTSSRSYGEWTITVRKVQQGEDDPLHLYPPVKVTTHISFPKRCLVQDETAEMFWRRQYGEPVEPLSYLRPCAETLPRPFLWADVGPDRIGTPPFLSFN